MSVTDRCNREKYLFQINLEQQLVIRPNSIKLRILATVNYHKFDL